jgi:transketolase
MTTTTTRTAGPGTAEGMDLVLRHLARITGDEKHRPSAYSTLQPIWVLYDRVLRVRPDDPDWPDRDRFVLSKGHGPAAYYAVLAAKGFFAPHLLDRFATYDGRLGLHPDRLLVPGVEFSSGSLGHGLPVAVGRALALRAAGRAPRVVVLTGDAELGEGSNWEAFLLAGQLGLTGLTAVVVDNRSVSHPFTTGGHGLVAKLAAFGWAARDVPASDAPALAAALLRRDASRPTAVVVVTTGEQP